MDSLTIEQILDAGLTDWRKLAQALHARFLTGDFATGLRFVMAVSEAAEAANHHPDVTLTYPHVDLKLISHDAGALTQRDIDLARRISEIAQDQGVAADPHAVAEIELALDTADLAAVGPFWAALL
ncbi:MAG TPA: 4a-hydroxytetrahydrobiopterin dehydratase, partial [Intrasporangium sp.]|uniref:4a-hydroxytetrahydrobiopterin dehydratase n=1 Tax=Intrasporangium sp. TaxID=1925024 RepID=UPI002F94D924